LASVERKVQRRRFSHDPIEHWATRGAIIGAMIGFPLGIILGLSVAFSSESEEHPLGVLFGVSVGGIMLGGVVGMCIRVVYSSLVKPVLLAVWNSDRFEEEYSSIEERQQHR
jgi:hypothetical protein